jgi:TatD DNase family protein
MDRCLIETDSPYLAPVPFRGKTNSPAYVPYVAQALAQAKSLPVEEVAWATSRNFEALFLRPPVEPLSNATTAVNDENVI